MCRRFGTNRTRSAANVATGCQISLVPRTVDLALASARIPAVSRALDLVLNLPKTVFMVRCTQRSRRPAAGRTPIRDQIAENCAAMLEAPDRIQGFLRRLTPSARGNLLIELEPLGLFGRGTTRPPRYLPQPSAG